LKQLSKYDITGVGLSLGDGGKDNKNSLRVVGVLLGSPAEMGGVKQVLAYVAQEKLTLF
jgi:hypothetical protein